MNLSASHLMLLTAIAFNVLTSTFFKLSSLNQGTKSTLLFIIGLLFGFANAYCYTKSLRTIDLNVAYPIFSAGSLVILSLVSYFFLREQFSLPKIMGVLLVIAGLYFISKA